jgi:hypothetical protein
MHDVYHLAHKHEFVSAATLALQIMASEYANFHLVPTIEEMSRAYSNHELERSGLRLLMARWLLFNQLTKDENYYPPPDT